MVDPRTIVINRRLSKVKRIVAVSSGKGGVGKSLVATTLALTLARRGCRVGLFDLDFTSPSTHIILNAEKTVPQEEKGIVPPIVHGIKYMSLIYYSGDKPAPLRGADVSNALIELLAVTQWGSLDFLVIDMPPGIGDVILDLLRLINRVEFLIVTTSSLLAFETVKKQVSLLVELKAPVLGVVENMKRTKNASIKAQTEKLGLRHLAEIDFDDAVEDSIGDEVKLLNSSIGRAIGQVVERDILKDDGCGKS